MKKQEVVSTAINRRGQIAIPAHLRKRLGLQPGDRIAWFYDEGELHTVPVPRDPITALRGSTQGLGLYDALMEERRQERERDEETS